MAFAAIAPFTHSVEVMIRQDKAIFIVAAVMGVILTMNLLGGDMDVAAIGNSIGAALVGT